MADGYKRCFMIYDLQKAGFLKRISAFIFDFIIYCVIAVGIAVLISTIVGYDAKLGQLVNAYKKYEVEYGIDLEISEEDYAKLTEAEKKQYEIADEAFQKDNEVARLYSEIFGLSFLMISLASLASFAITELAVPLFFKNGQTLGKKIFGIAVMRTDGVKVSFFQLFVRAVLGKHTVETMVPVLIAIMFFMGVTGYIGLIAFGLIYLLQLILLIATHTNSVIHDLLSVTVVVDANTQMIFDSTEQMLEFKKKKAEEAAIQQPY